MKTRAVLLPSLAVVLLAALVGQAAAAEEETARVLRFRRILVPAERLADWPAGGDKYLPLDAAEFERLATAAPARARGLRAFRARRSPRPATKPSWWATI